MAKKLISYDDTAPGTGLPVVVEGKLSEKFGEPWLIEPYESKADALYRVLYQADADTLYLARQNSTGTIRKTTDGGQTWATLGSVGFQPFALNRVEGSGTLIAVEDTRRDTAGLAPRVARSTDDGVTWTTVTTLNFPGLGPDTILSPAPGVVLLAEYGNIGDTVYRIRRSTDDGVTWTTVFSSSGAAPTNDPGHIHGLHIDPVENAIVAFVDYPTPEVWRSDDDGATWSLIGTTTADHHPNWVSPMFFGDHIAWGNDNNSDGRVYRLRRDDFYAGQWDRAEQVAKLGNARFYSSLEILPGVWLMAGAVEPVNQERPNTYNPRLYVVSQDGTQVDGGLAIGGYLPNLTGANLGTRVDLPGHPPHPVDMGGHTWINIPTSTLPATWSTIPITVGKDPVPVRITGAFVASPMIPHSAPIRYRMDDGTTVPALNVNYYGGVELANATGEKIEANPSSNSLTLSAGSTVSMSVRKNKVRLHGSIVYFGTEAGGEAMLTAGRTSPEGTLAAHRGSVYVQDGDVGQVWQRTRGANKNDGKDGWQRLMPAPEVLVPSVILSATSPVNALGKFHGRQVIESGTNRLLIAHGSDATAPWGDASGAVVHTPA